MFFLFFFKRRLELVGIGFIYFLAFMACLVFFLWGIFSILENEKETVLSASFFAGEHQMLPIGGDKENGFLTFDPKRKNYNFYWHNANIKYGCNYTISQDMVRFELDESYESPKLRFRWKSQPTNEKGQAVMYKSYWRSYVIYIVIRGKAKHLYINNI
ncbi:MAG: hypothetical protein U5L76_05830 [Patescibacteria group bacterium]|nr:hypothetical protein [Patescibacteria group bacterium]